MTHETDDELGRWRDEWQMLDGHGGLTEEGLRDRVARDGRRMRREAWAEALAVAFSTSASAWVVVRGHGAPVVVALAGLVLFFNGAHLTQFFQARANLYRACGEATGEYIALTRKRLDAEWQSIRFTLRWIKIIAAFVLPWSVWMFVAHAAVYRAEPWRGVVGFGGALAILVAVTLLTRRRARRVAREISLFEAQLAE
jgi:hypothetical protein